MTCNFRSNVLEVEMAEESPFCRLTAPHLTNTYSTAELHTKSSCYITVSYIPVRMYITAGPLQAAAASDGVRKTEGVGRPAHSTGVEISATLFSTS